MTVAYGITSMGILIEGISASSVISAIVCAVAAVISCPNVKGDMPFWKKLVYPFLWIVLAFSFVDGM